MHTPRVSLLPLLPLLLVAAAAACVEAPGPDTADPEAAFAPPRPPPDCEQAICGNTPIFGEDPFWEVDETMQQFSPVGGYRMTGMISALGAQLTPEVNGWHLIGRDGAGVEQSPYGATLKFESWDGHRYLLSVAQGNDVGALYYYENGYQPGDPALPTYELTYREVRPNGDLGPETALCPGGGVNNLRRDSLMFQGDRFDVIAGRVIATGDAALPWFNIACNDDGLWKLALMRYVEIAQGNGHPSTKAARTAALRSIRADYCGNGHPYTELGTHVDWLNPGGWLTWDAVANPEPEAIWGEHGALCLDVPRHRDGYGIDCDGRQLLSCEGIVGWPNDAFMRTYVPSPP